MSSSVRPFLLHDAMFPSLHTVVKQAEEGEEEIMLFAWSPAPFQRERKRRDRGSIKQTTGTYTSFSVCAKSCLKLPGNSIGVWGRG